MNPLFLLMILHLLFFLNQSSFAIDEHQFVYSGFTGANLTLDDMASITPDGLLELTNGSLWQKGHAFHPTPFRFSETPNGTVHNFAVTYVFAIYCVQPDICGHGIAFLIAPTNNFSDAMPTQYMGLVNDHNNGNATNHLFAVELDTNQNDEFKDINNNHVGIDVNGLDSVNSSSAGYYDYSNGNLHNLTLASYKMMQVWVEYDGHSTQINVTLAPLNMAKPLKPLLSTTNNLSQVIRDKAYIGFSSSTGSFIARQYVLGWSFGMNMPVLPIEITKLPKLPHEGPNPRSKVLEIMLPIGTAAFVTAVGTIVILLIRRKLRYAELREDWEVEYGPHRFLYKDLYYATEGFDNKNLLGIGGFGRVYKGVLPMSKLEIAVKRISHDSKQGIKEFVAEVVSIGCLQHRNVVQLYGYCRRKGELILVYKHMSNGSLDKYLYDQEKKPTLSWDQRLRIIKGVASGLLYLHEEWEKVVLHRDIKPSNVLLDDEMNGCLGDFGLARLYDHGADPQTTHVVGTIGYLAPELARTIKATPLTDVFSFGIFVLEVTCGRKPIEQTTQGNTLILFDWVLDCWNKGSLTDAVDVKLKGAYNVDEARLILKLGLMCSHPFTNVRPNMRAIMHYLNGDMPLPDQRTPADMSFNMLSFMQNKGFNPVTMTNSLSVTNNSAISDLSGGR
ncbi:L-type lectin-domain containing receptor kinase SIT2-like [Phragmites australis]|uniref:L-type lectin-domain containing receptor kinase SIT2-like n=1 Tax=Phragmites australis TaxID=29695 RepID=UPI002D7997E5|nr:L-type lectin-domain containing receptor kinase SIT2-like [Phragmites australis]